MQDWPQYLAFGLVVAAVWLARRRGKQYQQRIRNEAFAAGGVAALEAHLANNNRIDVHVGNRIGVGGQLPAELSEGEFVRQHLAYYASELAELRAELRAVREHNGGADAIGVRAMPDLLRERPDALGLVPRGLANGHDADGAVRADGFPDAR